MRFVWSWVDGEDDNAGNDWIEIIPIDEGGDRGDEYATIMLRGGRANARRDAVAIRESNANFICDALNAWARTH